MGSTSEACGLQRDGKFTTLEKKGMTPLLKVEPAIKISVRESVCVCLKQIYREEEHRFDVGRQGRDRSHR